MEPHAHPETKTSAAPLIVADWKIKAEAVVTACRTLVDDGAALRIVVPAWLHGIDWVGDPRGSVSCARAQLDRITQLCLTAGYSVVSAAVGDPDPVSAICDAVADGGVDHILLFARGRHVSPSYPLSVARRGARLTGLPLRGVAADDAQQPQRRRRFAGGHCEPSQAPQLT